MLLQKLHLDFREHDVTSQSKRSLREVKLFPSSCNAADASSWKAITWGKFRCGIDARLE